MRALIACLLLALVVGSARAADSDDEGEQQTGDHCPHRVVSP